MATWSSCCFRAGEIKQPKRRKSLIENAEKARISRQLVLLDDKVDLEVPLDDLAVQEPDARKLIAFLKAMEFSTLTRRVADYSQIDPSDVEADAANKSDAGAKDASPAAPAEASPARPATSLLGADGAGRKAGSGQRKTRLRAPRVPASRSPQRARKRHPEDRVRSQKYQTIGSLDQLKAWIARVHDVGHLVIEAMSELDRSDAGRNIRHRTGARAERCLLRPARPQAIRRRHGPVRCRPCAGPDQGRRCACGVEAAAGMPAFSRSASTSSSTR